MRSLRKEYILYQLPKIIYTEDLNVKYPVQSWNCWSFTKKKFKLLEQNCKTQNVIKKYYVTISKLIIILFFIRKVKI